MKFTLAILAAAGLAAAAPQPQGVTAIMTPTGAAPPGCSPTYPGNFEITIVKPSNLKRDITKRQGQGQCGQSGILTINLANGQLHDTDGRTGYIAGNNSQFQFDKPVQDGALYTAGFSICKNGSIALGDTTTFYQCQSGGFYNLYNKNVAAQCSPVNIDIIPCDGSNPASGAGSSGASAVPATPATSAAAAAVSQKSDGQPQGTAAASVAPVSVFSDGQPQATAAATSVKPVPVSEFTDGQPQATANATVKAAPSPTIVAAGAANLGVSGALFAGAAAVAAALL